MYITKSITSKLEGKAGKTAGTIAECSSKKLNQDCARVVEKRQKFFIKIRNKSIFFFAQPGNNKLGRERTNQKSGQATKQETRIINDFCALIWRQVGRLGRWWVVGSGWWCWCRPTFAIVWHYLFALRVFVSPTNLPAPHLLAFDSLRKNLNAMHMLIPTKQLVGSLQQLENT